MLRAFLRGRVDIPVGDDLARTLCAVDETELRADGVLPDRVAHAAAQLDPGDLVPLVPLLLQWWDHGPATVGSAAGHALRSVPADVLADYLGDRLRSGAWGCLDLLSGRPLLRTSALAETLDRLRAEGRNDLADGLRLVDGPLRGPDAAQQDAAAPAALRDSGSARSGGAPHRPSRQMLLDLARTGTPEQICRALAQLADANPGPHADQDSEVRELIDELLTHPRTRVRLRAHRTSRAMLDRQTYLRHTSILLDDAQPDVVRSAIRTLCHATWTPAVPAVTDLLEHSHPVVRRAAAEGLVLMGTPAIPVLRYAAGHARPDRRARYTDVLERITAAPR